jgi:Tol biopolymer transport system component
MGGGYGTIYRMLFGGRKATPFITPNSKANRFECAGCHAVSRDGSYVAFAAQTDGYLYVTRGDDAERPVIAPAATNPQPNATNMTISPDGKRVLVSHGLPNQGSSGRLSVWRTDTGEKEAEIDAAALGLPGAKLFFPEWSPARDEVVATVAVQEVQPWSVADGHIVRFPFKDGKFGEATRVVLESKDEFHYYPTWSPDGEWIAFVSAPSCGGASYGNGCVTYDNQHSRLRLVRRNGGRIYDLARATGTENTSTWPKFAPFALDGCKTFFLTFNTRRGYGFLVPPSTPGNGGRPQLWMSRIDTAALETNPNADPSSAPTWLPFQDTGGRAARTRSASPASASTTRPPDQGADASA